MIWMSRGVESNELLVATLLDEFCTISEIKELSSTQDGQLDDINA